MSENPCLQALKSEFSQLAGDDLDALADDVERIVTRARVEGAAGELQERVLAAVEARADDIRTAALIEKRNAALNLRRRMEAHRFITERFGDNPARGLEALLVGTNRAGLGNRMSAAAVQKELLGKYVGGFIAEVERAGLWEVFVSGSLDREIARELWALGNAATPPRNATARRLAEIVHQYNELARLDANRAGAWIKPLPGYVVRQSHDLHKIRRAGFDAWKEYVLPRLDLERTDYGDDLDGFLRGVFDGLASGVHMKSGTGAPSGFKGVANIGKKLSHERFLHFKDADAWFDYNAKFGAGSLRESLLAGLDRMAHATGLMRTWGPNAEANFDRVVDDLLRGTKGAPEARRKLAEARRGWLGNRLAEVTGATKIPVNEMGARVSANVRAVESMSKLGAAVLSSVTDIPFYASEMKYQGRSFLAGMAEALGSLFQGKGSAERRQVAGALGVFFDSMRGEVISRFSAHDDLGGTMTRLMQQFFKLNGLTWWTDTLRTSAGLSMSHRLALLRGQGWDALGDDLRRALGLYGIDAGRWDLLRQGALTLADGREYLTPEAVRGLSDEVFSAHLQSTGARPTPARVRELRDSLESQLRTYFTDRAEYAVIEPDAKTLSILRRGAQPGTVEGEVLRFIAQFKAFPAAVLTKALSREIYGRGATTLAQALKNGHGELMGLAQLMVYSTLFGYGAMALKDLAKGRTPRDPDDVKTWMAAMVQGGGLGIYGDFLFGEMRTRFGGGPIATALGPTAGTVEDVLDIIGRIRDGDDASAKAFHTLMVTTPFANLFYTRMALDYLFIYQISENLSPGYLSRMERRLQRENAQTFLFPPR